VTPTPTPAINLTTENSIAPVTCNGPARPPAARPFLSPPFRGGTSIVSYIDHDLPDFSQDGLVITSNGMEARPDAMHHAADFPAYWNSTLRQYLYYDGHNGYDYDLYYQPVYAAAAGKVIYAALEYSYAPHSGYGNMIMINHGHGYVTLYGHFSKILVKKGERVKRGQEIGVSGNTGHSSGPHLHFTVFHNCTPTDPYGWAGPGQDPLTAYQGETSVYLWKQTPLILNPPPGWPDLGAQSGTALPRILLLRLPGVSGGAQAFTRALTHEVKRVEAALKGVTGRVSVDPLTGTLTVTNDLPPAQLLRLPDVVSISTPDTVEGARQDVQSALAMAALHAPVNTRMYHRHGLTGYLMHWQGRTFLLGRAGHGRRVELRIPSIKSKQESVADSASGGYAVDLGKLTRTQLKDLKRRLAGNQRSDVIRVRRLPTGAGGSEERPPIVENGSGTPAWIFGLVALCALVLGAAGALLWRLKRLHA
jgi:murein DD-endopeptidase MepM/ murein hydrolase activator NlpD